MDKRTEEERRQGEKISENERRRGIQWGSERMKDEQVKEKTLPEDT